MDGFALGDSEVFSIRAPTEGCDPAFAGGGDGGLSRRFKWVKANGAVLATGDQCWGGGCPGGGEVATRVTGNAVEDAGVFSGEDEDVTGCGKREEGGAVGTPGQGDRVVGKFGAPQAAQGKDSGSGGGHARIRKRGSCERLGEGRCGRGFCQ